jgi:hypothetical protein
VEIRQFWNGVYARAVHALHLAPETIEVMQERLRRDGAFVDAGDLGPCAVCGHRELVYVLFTENLRAKLGPEHKRAGLCANCLTPRTAKSV